MNKVILKGNLVRDFNVTYTAEGTAVGRGSMALNRGKDKDGNDKGADFPNLVCFGKTAEFFEKYGKKGRSFVIDGHIQTGSYTNREGQKVYTTDVIVDRAEFADSKPNVAENDGNMPQQADGFMTIPDGIDEELPFN